MLHVLNLRFVLFPALLISAFSFSIAFAQDRAPSGRAEKRRQNAEPPNGKPATSNEEVIVEADNQSRIGDLVVADGYVNALLGDMRLQADQVTLNTATNDMVAEGNVIFDQGAGQRVTARRAEINWSSRTGVFWDTTGFTDRTETGEFLYFTAERVEKTGTDSYVLYNATVTACEDVNPKWSFNAKRAGLKRDDRLTLHGAVFKIRGVPALILPYAWIPVTKSERKSGFLIPTTGSSNQKGRTVKLAYYQTLGESADVTFRNDVYTQRGLGFGGEFRARTDEKSYLRLGVFTVKDRLFGPGEDQGGTAFVGEGVQYFPHGWLAVGNVSLVTSLPFRQVFSDDISQVIDPRRESTLYANNNTGHYSFNFLASNETTAVFRPGLEPGTGTTFDVKVRQAPEINLTQYARRIFGSLPIYFSFDSSAGSLKREETVDGVTVLVTPASVQRFDLQPVLTVPFATVAGVAVTASFSFRETYYTSSIDPSVPIFNPDLFTFRPSDPRLDPARDEFTPGLELFDRAELDRVLPGGLSRQYVELGVDVRPPALERTFFNEDGSKRFKHLIEPYITYRLIGGVGDEFERLIRFDDRDAVANTNELEFALVNRFFTWRSPRDLVPKRKRRARKPVVDTNAAESEPAQEAGRKKDKKRIEKGKQDELTRDGQSDESLDENGEAPLQPYEVLTVSVAQKYFFDRTFGGALIEGRRNQFYPINTLSGFSFGGVTRSFSPVNVSVRYRPLSAIYADVRMDLGSEDGLVRNVIAASGIRNEKIRLETSWYLSRRIEVAPNSFEPGTFSGNQVSTIFQFGDETKGVYGGARVGYDFTRRFTSETEATRGGLRNTRSFIGYGWDCCGVQFNYNTFKAGLRNESNFSFTFTLAGLGSFGTDQFSQLGGGRGGRKRGKRLRAYDE